MTILGLAISRDCVGAVLMSRRSEKWSAVRAFDGASRGDIIAQLLSECPRPRWFRPRVIAAIGPTGVQVKQITELPSSLGRKALHGIVRESAGRFFIKNGAPLEIACEFVPEDCAVWAAAYDGTLIDDVDRACHRAGWRLQALVPIAGALRVATRAQSVGWQDGDVRLEAKYKGNVLLGLRCTRDSTDSSPSTRDDQNRGHLLAAVGATQLARREPLAVRRSPLLGTRPSRAQLIAAAVSFVLAFLCWCLAPPLAATLRANSAQRALSHIAARVSADRRDAVALDTITATLGDISAFQARTRSMTLLLAEITRALPESCTITQLQVVDSIGGSVVALAPRAAEILDALERVPVIAAPAIAGPVASQSLGGRSLERASVSFRLVEP